VFLSDLDDLFDNLYSLYWFFELKECFIKLQETLHKHKLHKTEDQGIEEFAEQQNSSTTNKSLLKNWPLMSSIILFCVTAFDDMAYTEVCFDYIHKWTVREIERDVDYPCCLQSKFNNNKKTSTLHTFSYFIFPYEPKPLGA
jgi:hypothetical protein